MGRGDKKSKKGKRSKGSYGNTRNRKAIKARLKRANTTKPVVEKVVDAKPKAKRVVKKKEPAAE
jgi:ribosomal small subunit protein bTHX